MTRKIRDLLFICFVVLFSSALYTTRLGFYSDDWSFLAPLSLSSDQSLGGLFRSINSPWVQMRPVQVLYLAGLYWLSGASPLGYHLVNAFVMMAGILILFLILTEMGLIRHFSLAIALVFALLPHYSTNRYWVAASQINLSLTLYFLSLYSDLRALRSRRSIYLGWKALALAGLVASTLAYELVMPLFLTHPFVIWYRGRQLFGLKEKNWVIANLVSFLTISLPVLILIANYKIETTQRLSSQGLDQQLAFFVQVLIGAAKISYGYYGLGIGYTIFKILEEHTSIAILMMGVMIGLVIFWYLYRATQDLRVNPFTRLASLYLVAAGFGIFILGYAIFLTNNNINHTITGIGNRVAVVGALGFTVTLIGVVVWISTLFSAQGLRVGFFSICVALYCACGFIINNTLALFWIRAYDQETLILEKIHKRFQPLPTGSTLILDGICPYIGPAVVFESSWDLAGALRMIYKDYSLQADLVTPNLTVTESGLITSLYGGSIVTTYPYHENMYVYHYSRNEIFQLMNASSAHQYFQVISPDVSNGCPPGREGYGVEIVAFAQP